MLEVRPKQTSSRRRAAQKTRSVSPRSGEAKPHSDLAGDLDRFRANTDPWGSCDSFGAFPSTPTYGGWPGNSDSDNPSKEAKGFSAAFGESCTAAFSDLSQWGATDSPTTGDDAAGNLFQSPPMSSAIASDATAAEGSAAAGHGFLYGGDRRVQPEMSPVTAAPRAGVNSEQRSLQPEMSPVTAVPRLSFSSEGAGVTSPTLVDPWGYAYSPRSRPPTPRGERPFNNASRSRASSSAEVDLVDPWGYRYSPTPCPAQLCQ